MFQLADEGFDTPFEQLVACMISIRTLEEVTLPASRRLFARARAPAEMIDLGEAQIASLIRPSTFYERKAPQILAIAEAVMQSYGGELPCDADLMRSFGGVGPKCTNLALGIACGVPVVSADIHVHRIANRWGIIATKTPEQSMATLQVLLPEKYRVEINRLLVPFGKHVCTGTAPRCSVCPLLEFCQQVGVTSRR